MRNSLLIKYPNRMVICWHFITLMQTSLKIILSSSNLIHWFFKDCLIDGEVLNGELLHHEWYGKIFDIVLMHMICHHVLQPHCLNQYLQGKSVGGRSHFQIAYSHWKNKSIHPFTLDQNIKQNAEVSLLDCKQISSCKLRRHRNWSTLWAVIHLFPVYLPLFVHCVHAAIL